MVILLLLLVRMQVSHTQLPHVGLRVVQVAQAHTILVMPALEYQTLF